MFFHDNYDAFLKYENFHINNWIDNALHLDYFTNKSDKMEFFSDQTAYLVNKAFGTSFKDQLSARSYFEGILAIKYNWDNYSPKDIEKKNYVVGPSKDDMVETAENYLEKVNFNAADNGVYLTEACTVVKYLDPVNANSVISAAEKRITLGKISQSQLTNFFNSLANIKIDKNGEYSDFYKKFDNAIINYGKMITLIDTPESFLDKAFLTGLGTSSDSAVSALKATSADGGITITGELEKYLEVLLRVLVTTARYNAFSAACTATVNALAANPSDPVPVIENFVTVFNQKLSYFGQAPITGNWLKGLKYVISGAVVGSLFLDIWNIKKDGWDAKNAGRLAGDIFYALGLPGFAMPETTLQFTYLNKAYTFPLKVYDYIKEATDLALMSFRSASHEVRAANAVVRQLTTATLSSVVGHLFALGDIAIGVGQIIDGYRKSNTLSGKLELGAGVFNVVAGVAGIATAIFVGTAAAPSLGLAFFVITGISAGLGLASAVLDTVAKVQPKRKLAIVKVVAA